ncbi:unnamed protein product, partial [Didymodactylos carnosus]
VHLIQKNKNQRKLNQSMVVEDLDAMTKNGTEVDESNNYQPVGTNNPKDKSVFSMTMDELNEFDQTLNNKIEECQNMIVMYKSRMAEIESEKREEPIVNNDEGGRIC